MTSKYLKYAQLLLLVILLIIAIIFKSRANICGLVIGIGWLISLDVKCSKLFLSLWLLASLVFTLTISYFVKHDSSNGRLLIYKICLKMLKEHFFTGVGLGNFKLEYLFAQANYFQTQAYSIKELLLADNTQYSYNEYLQWLLELGMPGLVLMIFFYTIIIGAIRKSRKIHPNHHLLRLTSTLFISLSISACFTYTFHLSVLFITYIGCYLYIIGHTFTYRYIKSACTGLFAIISMTILVSDYSIYIFHSNAIKKFAETVQLDDAGYKNITYRQLDSLYTELKNIHLILSDWVTVLFNKIKLKKPYKFFSSNQNIRFIMVLF